MVERMECRCGYGNFTVSAEAGHFVITCSRCGKVLMSAIEYARCFCGEVAVKGNLCQKHLHEEAKDGLGGAY